MYLKKQISVMLAVFMLIGAVAFVGAAPGASAAAKTPVAPQWDQSFIDLAVGTGTNSMNVNLNHEWNSTMKVSQAIYALALMSYYNPELKSTGGKKVSDRLVEHLNFLVKGIVRTTADDDIVINGKRDADGSLRYGLSNEPAARGWIGNWIDNSIAQALALAKNKPEVWSKLSDSTKERCDFIMKYMAVAANYMQNYDAKPNMDLSQAYSGNKWWEPNFQEGEVHELIAAYYYFGGAAAVNKILDDFRYDDYIEKMDAYGFTNVKVYFELTGKALLENGGRDAGGGTVVGARRPFTYEDLSGSNIWPNKKVPYDPYQLYRSTALRNFKNTVQSKIYGMKTPTTVVGYIVDGSISPYEGLMGMCSEFKTKDGGQNTGGQGIRTSAGYVSDSIRSSIPTRATLEALGDWKGDGINDIESRMYVGIEDFLYKVSSAHGGYRGKNKGETVTNFYIDSETGEHTSLVDQGFKFYNNIWRTTAGKNSFAAQSQLSKVSGNTVTAKVSAYNLSLTQNKPITIITAVYNGNRMKSISTTSVTLDKKTTSKSVLNTSIPLTSQNDQVKLFVWDSLSGMQPLAESAEISNMVY